MKILLEGKLSINNHCEIRPLKRNDLPKLFQSFNDHGWNKPLSLFEKYLEDQVNGDRLAWVACLGDVLAGYVTLKWNALYPPFQMDRIPEIIDLNVLPPFWSQGIGTKLLEQAEKAAFQRGKCVGIGVGLYSDYGSAQRLYLKRGFVPDGKGVTYNYQPLKPGQKVLLDDDLVLWFTKESDVSLS